MATGIWIIGVLLFVGIVAFFFGFFSKPDDDDDLFALDMSTADQPPIPGEHITQTAKRFEAYHRRQGHGYGLARKTGQSDRDYVQAFVRARFFQLSRQEASCMTQDVNIPEPQLQKFIWEQAEAYRHKAFKAGINPDAN